MKRVIVESPYAGNIPLNTIYAQFACHDCLVNHNESPYASHLLYTQPHILNDELPDERELGIQAGFAWRAMSDGSVFYKDLGTSNGMYLGYKDCEKKYKQYEDRWLPGDLWERFQQACAKAGLPIPTR